MLYGSSKIWLNNLTKEEAEQLHTLATLSRDLYNLSINTLSNSYSESGKVLTFQELKNHIKDSIEYQTITGFYYSIVISAISDFKKYINTNSYAKNKSKQTLEVKNLSNFRLPMKKVDYYPVMIQKVHISEGAIILPKTKITEEIQLTLPANYKGKSISRVVVRPQFNFATWQLIIEYPVISKSTILLEKEKVLGIDLGFNNFATCAVTNGKSFIIDGKHLKGILQGYSKYKAKLLSKNGGIYNTRRLISLHRKTHNKVDDYIRKSVMYIIKYCIENHIGQIVLGWGVHFQRFDIGKNNQMYSLLPFAKFKDLLWFKCTEYGIIFKTVDESYSSQASFIDNDNMPRHVTRAKQNFSGKRRYRGLYVSKNGTKINADLNGALNILRKGNAVINIDLSARGFATPPIRVNPVK